MDRFKDLHRARQRYYRVLCTVSNRFNNCTMSYGQTRFIRYTCLEFSYLVLACYCFEMLFVRISMYMLLVLSITFYFHYNIWGCLCSTGPFRYRWLKRYVYSSCYYHHQIGSTHLSRCYHIFPWLCIWDVCYIIFCYLMHIHAGKTGNFLIIIVQFNMSTNSQIRFDFKIVFVYSYITPSHYHHCASLSEDIELIKCLSDTVCRVCE